MGGMKREIQEWEDDQGRRDWILEQYYLDEDMIDTEEWEEASRAFDAEMAKREAAEFDDWYFDVLNESNHFFASDIFSYQINTLLRKTSETDDEMFLKMAIAYAVTLMETCLTDMLVSVALESDERKLNALSHIDGLKSQTVSLRELVGLSVDERVDTAIRDHLRSKSVNYHNTRNIIKMFQLVTGQKSPELNVYPEQLKPVISLRNDITHRDGYDSNKRPQDIDQQRVMEAIKSVQSFVSALSVWLKKLDTENIVKDNELDF